MSIGTEAIIEGIEKIGKKVAHNYVGIKLLVELSNVQQKQIDLLIKRIGIVESQISGKALPRTRSIS